MSGFSNADGASRASHPAQAIAVYEQLIDEKIRWGVAQGYDEAVKLIDLRGQICKDPKDHAAYVERLALTYKAKRSFIARLHSRRR